MPKERELSASTLSCQSELLQSAIHCDNIAQMYQESFSDKKQLVLSTKSRIIQGPDDLEEFYLLDAMRDMI